MKRSYVRRKTTNRLEPDTTINANDSQSDMSNVVYRVNTVGGIRSAGAARAKKSRDIKKLKETILDKSMTNDQQAFVLYSVLSDPDLSTIVRIAGIQVNSTFDNIAIFNERRRLAMMNLASTKNSGKGRVTDDRRSFIELQLVSIAPSPIKTIHSPSINALIKHNNIPRSSGYRMINAASTKRKIIFSGNDESITKWSSVKKRKNYSKISSELREMVIKWLHNHPHVIPSPIYNDTLLVKNSFDTTNKTRVAKHLHQISIRELHNDLLDKPPTGLSEVYDKNGKPLISDTAFRALLPQNIKPMSDKYKQMCGCEICIMATGLQNDLNSYRLVHLRRLKQSRIDIIKANEYQKQVYNNGIHLHPHPKDALLCIQCPPVDGFQVPHMKCILRRCEKCPKYRMLDEERKITARDTHISFHYFQKVAKCTVHGICLDGSNFCPICKNETSSKKIGTFSNRKQMVLMKKPFNVFINEYYLPVLEKYAYHRPHFILLGKNETGALRKAALKPGDLETTRDYAERLSFKLDNEIMSLNFGNSVSLSMEGVSVRHFSKEKIDSYSSDKSIVFDEKKDSSMDFHSHLSDSCIQNAGSTHQHMTVLLDFLKKIDYIQKVLHYIVIRMVHQNNIDVQMHYATYQCYQQNIISTLIVL